MPDRPKPRYRNWESVPDTTPPRDPHEPYDAYIVIMPEPHSQRWYALWAASPTNTGGEFYGTRQEAIAWSEARCERIFLWSETTKDVLPYIPANES